MNSIVKRSATERLIIAKTLLESVLQDMSTAERRKGKWLDDCGGVKCSVCGHTIDDPYYVEDYCTKCGSFNGEEEDDEA